MCKTLFIFSSVMAILSVILFILMLFNLVSPKTFIIAETVTSGSSYISLVLYLLFDDDI